MDQSGAEVEGGDTAMVQGAVVVEPSVVEPSVVDTAVVAGVETEGIVDAPSPTHSETGTGEDVASHHTPEGRDVSAEGTDERERGDVAMDGASNDPPPQSPVEPVSSGDSVTVPTVDEVPTTRTPGEVDTHPDREMASPSRPEPLVHTHIPVTVPVPTPVPMPGPDCPLHTRQMHYKDRALQATAAHLLSTLPNAEILYLPR
ncbi:hypothetical protein KIPB_013852 [Kipferlia bialata]|uniref:Uncharacterized protein n=1 Tax=Kipferlia bialata TaxID=797122 RepID=A0A9K3GQL3_9EUKA|nr:hypothetical protein KIPB_013852 [Kipferlia bialata]|eukprot:g13852.t1